MSKQLLIVICTILLSVGLNAQVNSGKFYKIQAKNNNFFFGINGNSANGAPVLQQQNIGEGGQWEFIVKQSGYYQIKNKVSKKFVATFQNTAENAPIKQTSNPGEGALWKMESVGGGYYKLKNKQSGKYIANGSSTNSHSGLRQQTTVGNGGHWKFSQVYSKEEKSSSASTFDNKYIYRIVNTENNKALEVKNNNTVTLENSTSKNAQYWSFFRNKDGSYEILSVKSKMTQSLVFGNSIRTSLKTQASNTSSNQYWKIVVTGNGDYNLVFQANGKKLKKAMPFGLDNNGTKEAAKWKLESVKTLLEHVASIQQNNSNPITLRSGNSNNESLNFCDILRQLNENDLEGEFLKFAKEELVKVNCESSRDSRINIDNTDLTDAQKNIFNNYRSYDKDFDFDFMNSENAIGLEKYVIWSQSTSDADEDDEQVVKAALTDWMTKKDRIVMMMNNYEDIFLQPYYDNAAADLETIITNMTLDASGNKEEELDAVKLTFDILGTITGFAGMGTIITGSSGSSITSLLLSTATKAPGMVRSFMNFTSLMTNVATSGNGSSSLSGYNQAQVAYADLVQRLNTEKQVAIKLTRAYRKLFLSSADYFMNPEIIDLSFAYGQVNSPQLENKANEARTDLRKEIWRSLLPLNGLIKAVKVPYNEIGNACEIPSEYNTPKMIGYSSIESNTRPMEHYIWILQTGKPKESVDIGDGGGVGLNNLRALFTVQEILDMMKGKVYFKTGGVTSGMGAAIETYIGFDNIHKKQEYKSGSYVYEYPEPFCYQYSGGNMVDNRNQEVESTPTISNNSLFSNGQPVNINNLPVYELETNHNQGMVLDAESGSTANGANVIQFPRNGHENTKWVLQPAVQEGYFFIINKKSGKVMAVKGKSNQNDAQIVLNTFNSVAHENQLVKVTQINNTDYYSFQFKSSGKYLTIGTGGEKVTKGDQREKLYQRDLIAFPQPIGANVTPNNKRQYFKLKSLNNTGSSTTESVTISLKNSSIKTLKFFLSYTENGKNKTTDVTNSFTSGITKSVSISANATNLKITVLNALNSNVLNTSNLTNASICYKYRSGDITQCN